MTRVGKRGSPEPGKTLGTRARCTAFVPMGPFVGMPVGPPSYSLLSRLVRGPAWRQINGDPWSFPP